jgi:hypothetical protein
MVAMSTTPEILAAPRTTQPGHHEQGEHGSRVHHVWNPSAPIADRPEQRDAAIRARLGHVANKMESEPERRAAQELAKLVSRPPGQKPEDDQSQ